jgi:hypothetical protein
MELNSSALAVNSLVLLFFYITMSAQSLDLESAMVVKQGKVKVYPNPASENLNTTLEGYMGRTELVVLDIFGNSLIKKKLYASDLMHTILPIEDLPPWNYVLRVSNSDQLVHSSLFIVPE